MSGGGNELQDFEYFAPSSIDEAVTLLGRDGARPIAGGTDLLVHMRAGTTSPGYLVDLAGLGLSYVRQEAGMVKIGATTTFSELLDSELIRRHLLCLAESVAQIGAVQCRNMATIGGNLCSAVPSADSAPPLLVLGAQVVIVGRHGERVLPLDQFFAGPKQSVLQPGEILVAIEVPLPAQRTGTSFLKLGRRRAMTLAVVNAAALVSPGEDGRTVEDVRIALGAVAPTPIRARRAESILQGQVISEVLIEEAAAAAAGETKPISDLRATVEYRREVSRVLAKRTLLEAWRRATGETECAGTSWMPAMQPTSAGGQVRLRPSGKAAPGGTRLTAEAPIELRVNGRAERVVVKPQALLADVLRNQLGLTGTKKGCGTGECGACTVLLDGRPINSCLMLAVQAQNAEITTIEGLGAPGNLHPLQEAFIVHGALQCGFCGPGMLLAAKALLDTNPHPTEQDIRYAIGGNICRCTGYVKIVESIAATAQVMAQAGGAP